MKISSLLPGALALLALSLASSSALAAEKKVAGPNGGRIITAVAPRAEFFVLPDRKVQITFLGQDGKAVPPADQVVTVTAGERSAPKTLTFARSGNALVSNLPLPAGDAVPTVVQIKSSPAGKLVAEKFNADLGKCEECKLAEYACVCAH